MEHFWRFQIGLIPAGLFAIRQPPTGSKDPFALRRAAIGVLRLNEHCALQLDLTDWVIKAFDTQPIEPAQDSQDRLIQFIKDRERVRLTEEGYPHDIVIAVQSTNGLLTAQTKARVNALMHFQKNSDFAELIAIHKRVVNLLKDAGPVFNPLTLISLRMRQKERSSAQYPRYRNGFKTLFHVKHSLRPLQACSA